MASVSRYLSSMLLLMATAAFAEPTPEELERWFNSDEPAPPSEQTAHVNGGELVFLAQVPRQAVHHHRNRLVVRADSLRSGWVQMSQCHYNLDPVAAAQILFRKDGVRDLQIRSATNIEQAWVDGDSVQLVNVSRQAELCVEAWTRALHTNTDGSYSLRNGPFMRRFLDGYYPMQVSVEVDFADTGLRLDAVTPGEQEGFRVWRSDARVGFDAVFEGRLQTEIRFVPVQM